MVIPHPFGTRSLDEVAVIARSCVEQLVKLISDQQLTTTVTTPARQAAVSPAQCLALDDDFDAINEAFDAQRWTDGLPIAPPTPARVERMLAHSPLPRDTLIARIPPAFGAATVELLAINAVMAGLPPAAFPVLLAAVEAVVDPVFNLQAIQTTTNPVAVWLIVNGPVVERLGFNASFNCLGEGNRANATLGRTLRLVMRNVGGALPGEMDRATQGQPARYTLCSAEHEAASPWTSVRAEQGFDPDVSTVTAVPMEGTLNMNTHSKDGDEILRVFSASMIHPPSNEYVHGGEPWLLISPEHADLITKAGYDKAGVQERLWELTKMPAGSMAQRDFERARTSRVIELGEVGPETLLPIAHRAADIRIVVAGGPGTHSVYVPCFGNARAVTRAITMPDR